MEQWLHELAEHHYEKAWSCLAERYGRLMMATIRRLVEDPDDADDVFGVVSQALCENDLARLKRFVDDPKRGRFSTWLVAVVRNLTIDWLRRRDGRRQPVAAPAILSDLQREIYTAIFVEGRTHNEAYEVIAARRGGLLTFRGFLEALRETYRLALPRGTPVVLAEEAAPAPSDEVERAETARQLAEAMATFPPAHRLALELFVVEGMAAARVAQVVGWPNAKAVYNNVYRMLDALRVTLARSGITSRDSI